MRILFDGRALDLYHLGQDGFHGGTELMVKQLARGLAYNGHTVHVVTNDLPAEQQRGPTEWWWGPRDFPHTADLVVLVHSMEYLPRTAYTAPLIALASNGIDPPLLDDKSTREIVDCWPVFSETHKRLLCANRPIVDPDKVFITGLGAGLGDYPTWLDLIDLEGRKVPGRLLYANDPQRGLWHVLDIFDKLRTLVPDASLHVAYDFQRQFDQMRWQASAMGEMFWDARRRLLLTPGITDVGALTRSDLIREQLECQVHAMPSDPPNVGSQIHGILQMECAAAGAALVLSDTEAFPEVFGEAAAILPLPGAFLPAHDRRYDALDWAEVIADLMRDPVAWAEASRKARALAEQHTWGHVVDRWEAMLATLTGEPQEEPEREMALAVPGD